MTEHPPSKLLFPVILSGMIVVVFVPFLISLLDGFARPLVDIVINLPDLQFVLTNRPTADGGTEQVAIQYGFMIREFLAAMVVAIPVLLIGRWFLKRIDASS